MSADRKEIFINGECTRYKFFSDNTLHLPPKSTPVVGRIGIDGERFYILTFKDARYRVKESILIAKYKGEPCPAEFDYLTMPNPLIKGRSEEHSYRTYRGDEDGEIWKYFIDDFEISNRGRARKKDLNSNRIFLKKHFISSDGIALWAFQMSDKRLFYKVADAVYETFSGEPLKDGYKISHKDGDESNNDIDNLEQVESEETLPIPHVSLLRLLRLSKDGEFLAAYDTTADAMLENEIYDVNHINEACRNYPNKTHAGYKWRKV